MMGVAAIGSQLSAQEFPDEAVASTRAAVDTYRKSHETAILRDFVDLLSIPNVAANLPDMERNAEHIIGLLESRGFTTRQLNAGGAPYVYAELTSPGATETLLLYAHFDGQPVQEENWTYPPFSPTLLDGPVGAGAKVIDLMEADTLHPEWRLYARSAEWHRAFCEPKIVTGRRGRARISNSCQDY